MPPLQIRHVPDDLHAKLKAKAEARGQSLSEYALAELRLAAERISLEEFFADLDQRGPVESNLDTVAAIHEGRAER